MDAELAEHRSAAAEALRAKGYDVYDAPPHDGRGELLRKILTERIDGSLAMALLLGTTYGRIAEAEQSSWTEFEWRHAQELNTYAIIPFLHDSHDDATRKCACTDEQRQFIGRVLMSPRGQVLYGDFPLEPPPGNPTVTGEHVAETIHEHFEQLLDKLGVPRAALVTVPNRRVDLMVNSRFQALRIAAGAILGLTSAATIVAGILGATKQTLTAIAGGGLAVTLVVVCLAALWMARDLWIGAREPRGTDDSRA